MVVEFDRDLIGKLSQLSEGILDPQDTVGRLDKAKRNALDFVIKDAAIQNDIIPEAFTPGESQPIINLLTFFFALGHEWALKYGSLWASV